MDFSRRRRLLGLVVMFLAPALAPLLALLAPPAAASSGAVCDTSGRSGATVRIDAPAQDEVVAGAVTIVGQARAPLFDTDVLRRVVVSVDGTVVGAVEAAEGARSIDFAATWDAQGSPAGHHLVTVVACGDPGAVWGSESLDIATEAPAEVTSTTAAAATSTSGPAPERQAETAAAPVTTARAATTTVPAAGPEIAAPAVEVPEDQGFAAMRVPSPGAVRPGAATRSGPPLYPAVVAGLAGLAGVTIALAPTRGRSARAVAMATLPLAGDVETLPPLDASTDTGPAAPARVGAADRATGGGDGFGPLGHRPALDGIRAVAIVLVLLCHAVVPGFEGGALGVDIFFTLSGFLITSLLLEERAREGVLRLGRFWGRRAARLLPAVVVLVAVVGAYAAWGADPALGSQTLRATPWVLLYGVNWSWVLGDHPGMHGHLWSLAVEEQFYVLWPLALAGALALRRRVVVAGLVVAGMTAALVARLAWWDFSSIERIYGTDMVADQLLAGCGLALLLHHARGRSLRWMRAGARWLLPFAVAMHASVVWWLRPSDGATPFVTWFCTWGLTVVALATATVLLHVLLSPDAGLARTLARRPFTWLGERSYSLYLWHVVVMFAVRAELPAIGGWQRPAVEIALSIAAATLSFALVERPSRAWLRARLDVRGERALASAP